MAFATHLLVLEPVDHGETLAVRGDWCLDNSAVIEAALKELDRYDFAATIHLGIDFSGLKSIDLSGAWLLARRLELLKAKGVSVVLGTQIPEPLSFIEGMTHETPPPPARAEEEPQLIVRTAEVIGRESIEQIEDVRDALAFFGRIIATGGRALTSLRRFRLPAVVRQVYETGILAVPIVSLIAFLISVIVAYLGADQLRQFGADIYTVDLVAVAVLRELGVLLTAIIVAGRSGSAFAAEIGVMKLNDEVDALKSIGVSPFEVLVLPRLIGLIIAMPLLTIIADMMGLAGGAMLTSLLLDIPFSQFLQRMQEILAPTTFWAGLVKAPVFAALIAMVGTYRGMQVRDSSRELGRLTTVAVVQSIFLVILADAIFAVVFLELDF
jgi:phospholipid/cholesterol/gamma-HCH transport system permease protein